MNEISKTDIDAVEKILNTDMVLSVYPMIDSIDVGYLDFLFTMVIRINLNDPTITEENMYQKGMDPHYLIDFHLADVLPYLGIPRTQKIGFTVINTEGDSISSYLP